MKKVFLFIMFFTVGVAQAASKSPIASKEDVVFTSRQEEEILFITKSDDFVGTFERKFEPNSELQIVDLYSFPKAQSKMNPANCAKIIARIVGPKRPTIKVSKPEIFVSHTGKTCQVQVEELSEDAKFPERTIILGTLKTKVYAVIFKFRQKPTVETLAGTRTFWSTLR